MAFREPRVRGPEIRAESTVPPDALHIVFIENLELKAEAVCQLFLRLKQHRGRTTHNNLARLLAEQRFARDEAGLDCLTKAHIVGNEEVYTRQTKRLAKRFELIGFQANARAERAPGAVWGRWM